MSIGERIKNRRQLLGLNQEELAQQLGISRPSVVQWETGKASPKGARLQTIADILNCTPEWLLVGDSDVLALPESQTPMAPANPHNQMTEGLVADKDLPIYSSAQGGKTGMIISFEPIEIVKRPAPLMGVKGGYGIYLVGDSMEPVYRQGDILLVHPGKPPIKGDDVVVIMTDGNGQCDALVKRLVSVNDSTVVTEQFNPAKPVNIGRDQVSNIHLIVGSYKRR